ncbi:MAG: diaminopimelate decarboxylase [Candidatus Marinimicrobia bacterium]|nr:diaminopimelate decarboxylase [Candidatus Neomarinimicrobiota bacterium]
MEKIESVYVKNLVEKYGTPLYVYDFNKIEKNLNRLKNAFNFASGKVKIYYSLKAYSHPVIVNFLKDREIGFDCVSPGEIRMVLEEGVSSDKIFFTSSYESENDLKYAIDNNVIINLDDISSFKKLIKLGKVDFVSFRVNPGEGKGKYEQIITGGTKSKFGIPQEKIIDAYRLAYDYGIRRFGIHMMVGSGNLDKEYFPFIINQLFVIISEIIKKVNVNIKNINIGGGFGIPYYDDQEELDIEWVGQEILKIFENKVKEYGLNDPYLSIEPGRFIVGNAGYLVTRVAGIKRSYKNFIGVDAGFNIFPRPALYGAEHNVYLYKKFDKHKNIYNICGQICENTDILAKDRLLPDNIKIGDIIIFGEAGAYCSVLSSSYNLRFRPAEVAIYNGKDYLITERETYEHYTSRLLKVKF